MITLKVVADLHNHLAFVRQNRCKWCLNAIIAECKY